MSDINLERIIKAPINKVFEAIATGLLFKETGVINKSLKLDFKENGSYSFDWTSGGSCYGQFLKIETNRKVEFTWNSRGCRDQTNSETKVIINLEEVIDGTKLILVHKGLSEAISREGHLNGWLSSLNDFDHSIINLSKFENYDWSQFTVNLRIDASAEQIFPYLSTTKGLESFFVKQAEIKSKEGIEKTALECFQVGDRYHWQWWHGPTAYGCVLSCESNHKIVFSFGESDVEFNLLPATEFTWFQIKQIGIPTTDDRKASIHLNCRGGWIYFATVLKALIENKVDIRDKNPATAGSLALGFEIN